MTSFSGNRNYRWWVVYISAFATFIVGIDSSIVIVCFPKLAETFHVDASVISWVNITYLVLSQSLMLMFGRLGDGSGRKRVYMAGLVCYAAGLLICSFSQNVAHLLIGRSIQGIATAASVSMGMAIAVAAFPEGERGKPLGLVTSARSLGLVIGPVLGGLIVDFLGWRAVFFTRFPITLLGLFFAWWVIDDQKAGGEFRLDVWGSGTLFFWLSSLMLFLSFGGKWGFRTGLVLALGALTAVLFCLFLQIERKCHHPIINLDLFRKPLFAAASASATCQGATTMTVIFLLPFYLIQGLGYSSSLAGSLLSIIALPPLLVAPISGRLSDRMGSRPLSTLGMSMIFLAVYLLWRLDSHPGIFPIAAGLAVLGAGMGTFQPPNNSAILGSVPRSMLGTASAVVSTATQLGLSAGFAIAGTVFSARESFHSAALFHNGTGPSLLKSLSVVGSFHDTLLVAMVSCGLGVIACLVRGSDRSV
ncbi:MAG: Multidrug resistance protein stp [Syntrophorhabdaceae bacterium PtaU1.Bin034]|nr:MAG: Multidrug resistance protein stp [Syntrophorhabdaceae bacterium PtaU1.Bin034]